MNLKLNHRLLALGLSLTFLPCGCAPPAEEAPPPAKVPVTSEILEAGPFRATLRLLGVLRPSSRVEVRSRSTGRLHYPPRFAAGLRTGSLVAAGELLFAVEDQETRARRVEAELNFKAAEVELERAQRGFEGGFLPEADLKRREFDAELAAERLAQAHLNVDRLRHTAAVAGSLEVVDVLPPGAEVVAGHLMARLAGNGEMVVEAWAASRDLRRLQRGLGVRCLGPGREEVIGYGEVREVAGEVDSAGTVRVVVTVTKDLDMPPPGEGLDLVVELGEKEGVLTVPELALVIAGGVARVFVLQTSGAGYQAELRLVQLGNRSAGRVEVISGLQEGERVAVRGSELLADGLLAVEALDEGGP
jgi:RND family efflux transporter MFP subunit